MDINGRTTIDAYEQTIAASEYNVIDRDMEVILGKRISAGGIDGQRAEGELVKAHLRLAVFIAKKYTRTEISTGDLIQEGNIGLIKAAKSFDHTRGVRFSVYASYYIRQAIGSYVNETIRTIHIPRKKVDILRLMIRVEIELSQKFGRTPTREEIANELGYDEAALAKLTNLSRTDSLDAPSNPNSETPIIDSFIDHEVPSAQILALEIEDLADIIEQILARFKPREAQIIRMIFGLGGLNEHLQEKIGEVFGISHQRVQQIGVNALKAMLANNKIVRELRPYMR